MYNDTMTLNQVKLTSHIINKFTEQVKPSNQLKIESKEIFTDRTVFITDHALMRLNERLGLKKEKAEYAQFIRSIIYGTTKTFVTYKNERIFIANIAFGEVDMTLAFTRTSDEQNYLLITAFINSTNKFIEFMKKEYAKESKLSEVDKILKDSLFGGKSSEEFFTEFETRFGLSKHKEEKVEKNKPIKHPRKIQRHKQPDKEVYSQQLDEKYAKQLLEALGLEEKVTTEIKKVEVVKEKQTVRKQPNHRNKVTTNNKVKLHNQKLDDDYAKQLLDTAGLEEVATVEARRPSAPRKPKKVNDNTKLHNQKLDENYMEELLNSNTLVQQSVADIIEIEEVTYTETPIIREEDRETKIPEQKEVVSQELDDDFMNELLGDL